MSFLMTKTRSVGQPVWAWQRHKLAGTFVMPSLQTLIGYVQKQGHGDVTIVSAAVQDNCPLHLLQLQYGRHTLDRIARF